MRLGVVGGKAQSLAIASDRRIRSAQSFVGKAEGHECAAEMRGEGEGPGRGGHDVMPAAELGQNLSQIGVLQGGFGIERDGMVDQPQRRLVMTKLRRQYAQHMQRRRVIGQLREDRPIKRLGLAQAASLMVREGEIETLVDSHAPLVSRCGATRAYDALRRVMKDSNQRDSR